MLSYFKEYIFGKNQKGLTLIELIIVITILGILSALISGNFITSLKKGRDAQRKGDLEQIQRALEMYYEDNKSYPSTLTFGSSLCHPGGCSKKYYMVKLPNDPSSNSGTPTYRYCVDSDETKYHLYSLLENTGDTKSIITPDISDTPNCTTDCPECNYGISSPDTTPN